MLRSDYGRDLADLQTRLADMGQLVEAATRNALAALEQPQRRTGPAGD